MELYQPGEIISVSLESLRVIEADERQITVEVGADTRLSIPRYALMKIERIAPADGSPQPGDVWLDRNGFCWHAVQVGWGETSEIRLISATGGGDTCEVSQVLNRYGPLTLAYRHERADEEVSA